VTTTDVLTGRKVVDLVPVLHAFPSILYQNDLKRNIISAENPYPKLTCRYQQGIRQLFITVSLFSIAAIAIDRLHGLSCKFFRKRTGGFFRIAKNWNLILARGIFHRDTFPATCTSCKRYFVCIIWQSIIPWYHTKYSWKLYLKFTVKFVFHLQSMTSNCHTLCLFCFIM